LFRPFRRHQRTMHRRFHRSFLILFFAVCVLTMRTVAPAADTDMVSLILIDGDMRSDWPDRGVVGIRRAGSTGSLSVNFTLSGSALRGTEYTVAAGNSLVIPDGDREAWLECAPTGKTLELPVKSITVTLAPGSGYAVTPDALRQSATIKLGNVSTLPSAKAAVRFLVQAGFGPGGDFKDVEEVMKKGYDRWITDQFARPVGLHQGTVALYAKRMGAAAKPLAWWARAMNSTAKADPLRQRVGFALSEIFVISDRLDDIGNQPVGMANYYDMLLKGAFGNYRDLLYNVGTHPCMGVYLNHLQNEKGDPEKGTFADENFAREVMQLFSIGLWELNQDGTPVLDAKLKAIPTYNNTTIANMARVMTGFSFGGKKAKAFYWADDNYAVPMRMWDEYHDPGAKTLLRNVQIPARPPFVEGSVDTGAAGLADFKVAIDCLFNHSNTPPFIGKQLIQKLVTSNPSPGYISRVAGSFINNGSGVRGDLKAVIRAILLDPEARDPRVASNRIAGKMKEPYLRTANLIKATRAKAANGVYRLNYLGEIHFQEPLAAPSVFNFFKPGYAPAGPVNDAGLVAPEFQIVNSVTAFSVPNYYFGSLRSGFNRWGGSGRDTVKPLLTAELALVNDVAALLRRLDLLLTGGTLPNEQHQVIREAVEAITPDLFDWKAERVRMAIYLIATVPEFGVIK
jgi:uncharacterized protein (DUF1800 family)